jgi:hypothetical protein
MSLWPENNAARMMLHKITVLVRRRMNVFAFEGCDSAGEASGSAILVSDS